MTQLVNLLVLHLPKEMDKLRLATPWQAFYYFAHKIWKAFTLLVPFAFPFTHVLCGQYTTIIQLYSTVIHIIGTGVNGGVSILFRTFSIVLTDCIDNRTCFEFPNGEKKNESSECDSHGHAVYLQWCEINHPIIDGEPWLIYLTQWYLLKKMIRSARIGIKTWWSLRLCLFALFGALFRRAIIIFSVLGPLW